MFLSDDKIRPVRDLRRTGQWQTMWPTASISLCDRACDAQPIKAGFGPQLERGVHSVHVWQGPLPRLPHIDQADCESLLSA